MIPPLFDSRINLTSELQRSGLRQLPQRRGQQDDRRGRCDEPTSTSRPRSTAEIDDQLGKDVAYIPLEITKFYFLRGSKVTGYINNPASAGYPDLGAIGVEQLTVHSNIA